jgi:hypothetical protein
MITLANDAAAMNASNSAVRTHAARCDVCAEFACFIFDTFGSRRLSGQATTGGFWKV